MIAKNVMYTDYDFYLNDLIKSLSNFCNKCPLKPKINVVKEMGKFYVSYNDEILEYSINVNENKKVVIGDLKRKIEKYYPVIYKKSVNIPTVDEVKKMLENGKSLEEALNSTQITYEAIYKIERVHDSYNELDLRSLLDDGLYKFKSKIPVVAILENLKYDDKADVLNDLNFLYKICKNNPVEKA